MRPDNKFARRTNEINNSSPDWGSDSPFVTGIGSFSSDTTIFGGPDSLHRPNPHATTIKRIAHLGRTDRGQPLYHGGFDPDEDDYGAGEDGVEFEKEIISLELKEPPKFTKSNKA